jgi:hypothetical protein
LLVYNTATAGDVTPGYYYWNSSKWVRMINQDDNDGDWTVSGNDMYSAVSGNVGIGTSNPQTLLHLQSTSNEPTLRILGPVDSGGIIELGDTDVNDLLVLSGGNGGSNYEIGIFAKDNLTISTDGLHPILFYTNGYSNLRMTIAGNGNVGIGTTSPSQRLHVSGNMRLTGALYDVNNQAGTSGQVLTTTGSGVDWVDASTLDDGDWTVSGNDMYSAVSGNVGIGTNSPGKKLDVVGELRVDISSGKIEMGDLNTFNAASNVLILDADNGVGGFYDQEEAMWILQTDGDYTYIPYRLGVGFDATTGFPGASGTGNTPLVVSNGTNTGDIMNLYDNTTEVFTVLDGGNVGIGTTSPSQRLHVSGNMRLTGALYDVNNDAGTSGQVLTTTGSGVD